MGCCGTGKVKERCTKSAKIPEKSIYNQQMSVKTESKRPSRLSACFSALIATIRHWFCWFRTKEQTATVYPAPLIHTSESGIIENDVFASEKIAAVSDQEFEEYNCSLEINTEEECLHRVTTTHILSSTASSTSAVDTWSNGDGLQIIGAKEQNVCSSSPEDLTALNPVISVPSVNKILQRSLLQLSPRPKTKRGAWSFMSSNGVGTLAILQICNFLQKLEDAPTSPSIALSVIATLNTHTTASAVTSTAATAEMNNNVRIVAADAEIPLANETQSTVCLTSSELHLPTPVPTSVPEVSVSMGPTPVPEVKEFSIGPTPVPISYVESFMEKHKELEFVNVDFDLRPNPAEGPISEHYFIILETIFNNPKIKELEVRIENWRNHIRQQENILPPEGWEFGRNGFKVTYSIRLRKLKVHCPGLSLRHLLKWRILLNCQDRLESLASNLDSVSWTLYKRVLRNNQVSLTTLELLNITNHNGDIQHIQLFDWSLLNDLWNLSRLKLWGDTRYYGLRTRNFLEWRMERLEEIELKYVDLTLEELKHLLNETEELRIALIQFFIPIPDQTLVEVVPASDFLYLVACVLAERKVHQLIFLDYKLPGPLEYRRNYLLNAAKRYYYKIKWSAPENLEYDYMEFQIKIVD